MVNYFYEIWSYFGPHSRKVKPRLKRCTFHLFFRIWILKVDLGIHFKKQACTTTFAMFWAIFSAFKCNLSKSAQVLRVFIKLIFLSSIDLFTNPVNGLNPNILIIIIRVKWWKSTVDDSSLRALWWKLLCHHISNWC